MPLLSILICTMPSRLAQYKALWAEIDRQRNLLPPDQRGEVEIRCDPEMGYSVGVKRNLLLQRSSGLFVVFIDDDDWISTDYIAQILAAIRACPEADCIGIQGYITTNGHDRRQWFISKDYGNWYERNSVYYRTPNHISPVRRVHALQAGFTDKTFGEDHDYSIRLQPMMKVETKIAKDIYYYLFTFNK